LLRFALFDSTVFTAAIPNELKFVEDYVAHKLDSSMIIQTYVRYGRRDGRAYRDCTPAEASQPVRSSELELVTGKTEYKTDDYSAYRFCLDKATAEEAAAGVVDSIRVTIQGNP
jgi:hypothetical protein